MTQKYSESSCGGRWHWFQGGYVYLELMRCWNLEFDLIIACLSIQNYCLGGKATWWCCWGDRHKNPLVGAQQKSGPCVVNKRRLMVIAVFFIMRSFCNKYMEFILDFWYWADWILFYWSCWIFGFWCIWDFEISLLRGSIGLVFWFLRCWQFEIFFFSLLHC